MIRVCLPVVLCLAAASAALAQQRPLLVEDPEPIGAGRLLIESGFDVSAKQKYPVSGLEGTLVRVPTVGISVGLSSIAEFQIDGGFFNRLAISARNPAPLSGLLFVPGDTTSDVEDFVVATKIRFAPEAPRRPALSLRFATKLPNADNEPGLGMDTTDFFVTLLAAKTVQSLRVVGNVGLGILGDATNGERQNDVLTYGASFARAFTSRAELVGEVRGRVSTRAGGALPGTETRGTLNLGGRYTRGPLRVDTHVFLGMTPRDPSVGFGAGFTYVFHAFDVP